MKVPGEQFVMMLSIIITMELKLLAAHWVFQTKMQDSNQLSQLLTMFQLGWIKLNAKAGKEVSLIAEETPLETKIAATLRMLVLSVKEVKEAETAQMVQWVMLKECSMITSDLPSMVNVIMECAMETTNAALMSTCPMSSIMMIKASTDASINSPLMSTSRSKLAISQ